MCSWLSKEKWLALAKEILGENSQLGYINPALNLSVKDFVGWQEWFYFGEHPKPPQAVYFNGQPTSQGEMLLKKYGFV